jgi:hypothetical protein
MSGTVLHGTSSAFCAAHQAGELVLRQRVRDRRHSREDGAGIGAEDDGAGQRAGLSGLLVPGVVLRPAAVGQPAHDGLVLAQHLHAVDAEVEVVLAVLGRTLGDDQTPGDQGRRLAGPAGLDGQAGEVDPVAREHDVLHRGRSSRPSAAST